MDSRIENATALRTCINKLTFSRYREKREQGHACRYAFRKDYENVKNESVDCKLYTDYMYRQTQTLSFRISPVLRANNGCLSGFVRVRRWKFVQVHTSQKRARKRKHARNVRGEKLRNYQLHTSDIWCVRHEVWTAEKEQRLGDAAADGRFRYETETTREPREREKWRADRDNAQTKEHLLAEEREREKAVVP